jgi:KaiC/GvpD/RAD55 family RecA-like ATPase
VAGPRARAGAIERAIGADHFLSGATGSRCGYGCRRSGARNTDGVARHLHRGTLNRADAIIMQRYIELKGQLQRIMAVVKVRGSPHSKEMRTFEITDQGIVMGETLGRYEGLLTGRPELIPNAPSEMHGQQRRRRRGQRPTRR